MLSIHKWVKSYEKNKLLIQYSVSSSEEAESSNSDRFVSISSLAHAMVQERLDQMIRERQEARQVERRRQSGEGTKFIVMVALEKCFMIQEKILESPWSRWSWLIAFKTQKIFVASWIIMFQWIRMSIMELYLRFFMRFAAIYFYLVNAIDEQ